MVLKQMNSLEAENSEISVVFVCKRVQFVSKVLSENAEASFCFEGIKRTISYTISYMLHFILKTCH